LLVCRKGGWVGGGKVVREEEGLGGVWAGEEYGEGSMVGCGLRWGGGGEWRWGCVVWGHLSGWGCYGVLAVGDSRIWAGGGVVVCEGEREGIKWGC